MCVYINSVLWVNLLLTWMIIRFNIQYFSDIRMCFHLFVFKKKMDLCDLVGN